jgi:hypothetical protein
LVSQRFQLESRLELKIRHLILLLQSARHNQRV